MTRTRAQWIIVVVIAIGLFAGPSLGASAGKGAVVVPAAKLAWTAGAIPGVSTAVVAGDLATGPSRFYLKYAAGLVTPPHHHSRTTSSPPSRGSSCSSSTAWSTGSLRGPTSR